MLRVPLAALLPRVPHYRCSVCDHSNAPQLVPERGQAADGHEADEALCYLYCTVCLDELVGLFPLTPRMLRDRELTGRLRRGR